MSERQFNQLEFAIFCIENVAEALGVPGNIAYRKLAIESNILSDYIFKHFDILHTQGSAWIREDLLAVMKRKASSHEALPWLLRCRAKSRRRPFTRKARLRTRLLSPPSPRSWICQRSWRTTLATNRLSSPSTNSRKSPNFPRNFHWRRFSAVAFKPTRTCDMFSSARRPI